jgi:hypothetical protein
MLHFFKGCYPFLADHTLRRLLFIVIGVLKEKIEQQDNNISVTNIVDDRFVKILTKYKRGLF